MAAPIILSTPELIKESDDAGNYIVKTILPRFVSSTPRYHAYGPEQQRRFTRVPRLASFCILTLSQYPEQLHQLGEMRLYYDQEGGTDRILKAVLPRWRKPNFSLLDVDPRIWATITQIYTNLPPILSSYPCQLSDPYVPLLNQIPCTPSFSLLTVLDLTRSSQVTDSNIVSLKPLHNLVALDLSYCQSISSRAIAILSMMLTFNDVGQKQGPWALRILRLRGCRSVERRVLEYIQSFRLLSVVDLRDTRCSKRDITLPFFSASDDEDVDISVFELSLSEAVRSLWKTYSSLFPSKKPFVLSLQEKQLPADQNRPSVGPQIPKKVTGYSKHNNYVVLLPVRESPNKRENRHRSMVTGNTDQNEFCEKKREKEERNNSWECPSYSDYDSDDNGEYSYDWDLFNSSEEDDGGFDGSDGSEELEEEEEGGSDGSDESDAKHMPAAIESTAAVEEARNTDPEVPAMSNVPGSSHMRQRMEGTNSPALTQDRIRTAGVGGVTIPMPAQEDIQARISAGVCVQIRPLLNFADAFYWRPTAYHVQKPQADKRSYELALFRFPPPWSAMEAINSAGPSTRHVYKRDVPEDTARVIKKRKASMQLLQAELSKRQRAEGVEGRDHRSVEDHAALPSPSPPVSIRGTSEITSRRPLVQPISNLKPPPRSLVSGRPRLKLEPTSKSIGNPPAKLPARFSAVVKKPRNMDLAEGFKLQARRPALSPFTGISIKRPMKNATNQDRRLPKKDERREDRLGSLGT